MEYVDVKSENEVLIMLAVSKRTYREVDFLLQ